MLAATAGVAEHDIPAAALATKQGASEFIDSMQTKTPPTPKQLAFATRLCEKRGINIAAFSDRIASANVNASPYTHRTHMHFTQRAHVCEPFITVIFVYSGVAIFSQAISEFIDELLATPAGGKSHDGADMYADVPSEKQVKPFIPRGVGCTKIVLWGVSGCRDQIPLSVFD